MDKKFAHKAKIETRKDSPGVLCRCGDFNAFGMYGVAQMAMGHTLERNCKCGLHIEIKQRGKSHVISAQHEGHIFRAGSKSVKQDAS